MKATIQVRRGGAWSVWAEITDPTLWPLLQEREAIRVKAYEAERAQREIYREQAKENRRLAQRVALERKEEPPPELEEAELPFVPPELDKEARSVRLSYTPVEFVNNCEPGGALILVGTTALALEQNGWADEVRIEVEPS